MKETIVYRISMGFTQTELDWITEMKNQYENALGITLSTNKTIKSLLFENKNSDEHLEEQRNV